MEITLFVFTDIMPNELDQNLNYMQVSIPLFCLPLPLTIPQNWVTDPGCALVLPVHSKDLGGFINIRVCSPNHFHKTKKKDSNLTGVVWGLTSILNLFLH